MSLILCNYLPGVAPRHSPSELISQNNYFVQFISRLGWGALAPRSVFCQARRRERPFGATPLPLGLGRLHLSAASLNLRGRNGKRRLYLLMGNKLDFIAERRQTFYLTTRRKSFNFVILLGALPLAPALKKGETATPWKAYFMYEKSTAISVVSVPCPFRRAHLF